MWKCNRCGASTPKTCTCPKAGDATPPATPQPETPMKLEGYDGYQFCPLCGVVLPCRAHGRVPVTTTDFAQLSADCALSTPPDVERLKMEIQLTMAHEKIAALLTRIDELSWRVAHYEGEHNLPERCCLELFERVSPSTPGEPT